MNRLFLCLFFLAGITQKQFIFFPTPGTDITLCVYVWMPPVLFIVSAFVGNLSAVTFLPNFDYIICV